MLVIDVAEGDVRGVVLKQSKVGCTRDSGREVEVEVALARLLLTTQRAEGTRMNQSTLLDPIQRTHLFKMRKICIVRSSRRQ